MLVYSLLVPVILFLLLPLAFYRLAKTFWMDECKAAFCLFMFLVGSPLLVVFFTDAIIPQSLAFLFLLLGLEAMIRDIRNKSVGVNWSVAQWGILTLLTHAKGIYLYLFAATLWLMLAEHRSKYWWMILAGGGGAFLVFAYRPAFYNPFSLPLGRLAEVVLLWLAPLNLYLADKVFSHRNAKALNDASHTLLDVLIIACVVLSLTDYAFRPILFASGLLALYSGVGLMESRNRVVYAGILVAVWLGYLIFNILAILTTL
jgi:hypothetical protein